MPNPIIANALQAGADTLQRFMADGANLDSVEAAAQVMISALAAGGKIMSCGNGGSHCDAMHFAEELSGRFRADRPALAAMAISDASHISCVGNDMGFEHIFSRMVEALGRPGDVLLGISTSGNSANVIRAVAAARASGMAIVLLLGKDGGALAGQGDAQVLVAHNGYADRIQEVHIKVIHIWIELIEAALAPVG